MKKKIKQKESALIGKWCWRLDKNGEEQNQGQIIRENNDGSFLFQLYSYINGLPTTIEIVSLLELKNRFKIFSDNGDMKAQHDENERRREFEEKHNPKK